MSKNNDEKWEEAPNSLYTEILLRTEEASSQIMQIIKKYKGLSFHIYTPVEIINSHSKSAIYSESLGKESPFYVDPETTWREVADLEEQLTKYVENGQVPINIILTAQDIFEINEVIKEIQTLYPMNDIVVEDFNMQFTNGGEVSRITFYVS